MAGHGYAESYARSPKPARPSRWRVFDSGMAVMADSKTAQGSAGVSFTVSSPMTARFAGWLTDVHLHCGGTGSVQFVGWPAGSREVSLEGPRLRLDTPSPFGFDAMEMRPDGTLGKAMTNP